MKRLTVLLAMLLAACATAGRPSLEPPYDLLIVHGRIVDGTGNPWFYGDVAIRGDRIARVGPGLDHARARRVIDARGMVVSPGFIDMLGHSERTLLAHPQALSKITQGITSEITGEVTSVWPVVRDTTRGGSGDPPWSSLAGYFHELERRGTAINLGTYIGAGSVRSAVMGDASRRPTPEELSRMGDLVEQGMRDGAMGFSTGLIYPPSTWFTTDELTMLARRAAAYGGGYASHIRSEGPKLLDALREAIAIGTGAGTWIEIRHLKASGAPNWGKMPAALALIDSARSAGVDIAADQYPYTASGTGLSAILPSWVQAGGVDSMLARLGDSTVRARLRAERLSSPVDARAPDQVLINEVESDSLRAYEGKMLDEVGRMRHEDPYDAAYDILIADHGATSAIYFTMSEEDVRLAMREPWVSVGQDAGAVTPDSASGGRGHPRGFGTFPRILGRYVREDSVLTLPQAVRKMTSLAAQRVGLDERGVLKRGLYADVVVFDPATIIDHATYEQPQQLSTGVRWVVVNGVLVLDDGKPTGALPGRALLGPGARR
ncbi:MAG TPA: D-aminoacylase [Gemmatimonadaceae bacterium]